MAQGTYGSRSPSYLRIAAATAGSFLARSIRAQLKQLKKLKLKVNKQVGKAYSPEEKTSLLEAAKGANRSKGILPGPLCLLSLPVWRDKEIRTLQWDGFDLVKRIVTVGGEQDGCRDRPQNPDERGSFRRSPGVHEMVYGRFGAAEPEWYVFPFGKPRPTRSHPAGDDLQDGWARQEAGVTAAGTTTAIRSLPISPRAASRR